MERRDYYVSGNTVRRMAPQPLHEERRRNREELERIRRQKVRRNAARRNRERAMYMSKSRVIFLSVCVLLAAVVAGTYVQFQANVSDSRREIANMEEKIADLRADNDARYRTLINSVDLEQVKQTAMKKLGMSYPKQSQIVYYRVDKNSFMDQYKDIPVK